MSEPLSNVELIYEHTGERHLPECPFVIEYGQVSPIVCTCPHIIGQFDSYDKLQATIATLTAQLAERTRERDEAWSNTADDDDDLAYVTASKNVAERERDGAWAETNRHVDLLRRTLDRALAAEQRVKELHKPDTVDVLPWKCVNGDCEHDDTECPEEPHQVCRECWNLWTRDGRDDECFYEDQVGWPCATAHAAALAALPTDPQDCPGCIVDAEYPVGISGTHTCRPIPQEPTP